MRSISLNKRWFGWNPSQDSVAALLTAAVMTCGGYYLLVHLPEGSPLRLLYHLVFLSALVIVPVWWYVWHRGGSLSDLGLKRDGWSVSLLISLILTGLFFFSVLHRFMQYGGDLIPHFISNGLILWEPFLIFSWYQLRFEKDFGIIPGILFAGVGLGAYHLGTYGAGDILMLIGFGIVFAVIFRATSNLIIMWPLTWSTASAEGTLQGGFLLGWHDALLYAVILIIQLIFIGYTWKRMSRRSDGPEAP